MSSSTRSLARQVVLQALYACEFSADPLKDPLGQVPESGELDERGLEFAQALFDLTLNSHEWADQQITDLAHNWKLERIAVIDRIILRMAMAQVKGMPDIPLKVALNEAIELAKTYSTAESPGFINGILDSFIKSYPSTSGV